MTISRTLGSLLLAILLLSCGGKEDQKKEGFSYQKKASIEKSTTTRSADNVLASKQIDLSNKGVGPVKSLILGDEIDEKMVVQGADIFKQMCSACHRANKKFIGPAPHNILERRTPEWIMNMILDPEGMVKNDPLARALLIEFNGSPMANQNLTQEEARSVLEYFRTLK